MRYKHVFFQHLYQLNPLNLSSPQVLRVSIMKNNSNRFTTHSHYKKQDLVTSTYAQLISYKSTEKKVTAPYTSSPLPSSSKSPCKTYKHIKQTCTHIQRHKNHR